MAEPFIAVVLLGMNSLLKVSGRNHLGLILMAELAHRSTEDGWLSLSELATKMRISVGYLEEVAKSLRDAGLVEGRKGPGGGYRLSQQPSKITIESVLVALEGPLAMVDCQASDKGCPVAQDCTSKSLWDFLHKDVVKTLQRTTLADVV